MKKQLLLKYQNFSI